MTEAQAKAEAKLAAKAEAVRAREEQKLLFEQQRQQLEQQRQQMGAQQAQLLRAAAEAQRQRKQGGAPPPAAAASGASPAPAAAAVGHDGAASATVEVTCDGDGLGRRLVHVQTVQLLPQEAMEAGWSKKRAYANDGESVIYDAGRVTPGRTMEVCVASLSCGLWRASHGQKCAPRVESSG